MGHSRNLVEVLAVRIYGLRDQHDHRLRPPAGVVVLLGSQFL